MIRNYHVYDIYKTLLQFPGLIDDMCFIYFEYFVSVQFQNVSRESLAKYVIFTLHQVVNILENTSDGDELLDI